MASSSPLLFLPAHELAQKLASGETSSVELVSLCLDQIERHNRQGLKLHAIISACPRDIAVAEAEKLDKERKEGSTRSGLHGLPIVIKDVIATDPVLGMTTTAGAAVFKHMKARKSAPIVDRLREAGLIIIGKGNLTEYCGLKSNDTPTGWSPVEGKVSNIFRRDDLEEKDQPDCQGSSAGPAVSITAGFAPLAIGSETAGSIVCPAAMSGLYGAKLTLGSVPGEGCQKLSESFDVLGPIARDPRDVAALAAVMMGRERSSAGGFGEDMGKGFGGLAVGVVKSTWGIYESLLPDWNNAEVVSVYENAVEKMKNLGGKVVYPLETPESDTLKHGDATLVSVAYHQFRDKIKEFISYFEPDPEVTSLQDIIAWNEKHAEEAMPPPSTGQTELIASANNTMDPSTASNGAKELRRLAGPDGIGKTMSEHGLDVVLSASSSTMVTFAACAGWPIAALPLARREKNGQPYGMFAVAREGKEDVLFSFMCAWHDAFGGIEFPKVL